MSKEDELAQALIRSHKESQEREKEFHENADDAGVYPEAHYNHYGTRGVADLYLTIGDWEGHLIEFKSETAVQNATGANEIIRQFNQMRKYFFEGSDHDVPTRNLMFELCFTATESNIRHLAENAELYASVVENEYVKMWKGSPKTHVAVRLPEPITPLTFFSPQVDFRDGFQELSFLEFAKRQNPELVGRFAKTFGEIT